MFDLFSWIVNLRVSLLYNRVFYAVLTYKFFLHHRIKIQQPPPFFYLQPPHITDYNFFSIEGQITDLLPSPWPAQEWGGAPGAGVGATTAAAATAAA